MAGLGVQVLFGFLLSLPFTNRFTRLSGTQRDLYLTCLLLSAVATALPLGVGSGPACDQFRRQFPASGADHGRRGCPVRGLWFGFPFARRRQGGRGRRRRNHAEDQQERRACQGRNSPPRSGVRRKRRKRPSPRHTTAPPSNTAMASARTALPIRRSSASGKGRATGGSRRTTRGLLTPGPPTRGLGRTAARRTAASTSTAAPSANCSSVRRTWTSAAGPRCPRSS